MMGSVVIRPNSKVSFLGVPPQGVCTHEGTRAAGLRAIGEVINLGCFCRGGRVGVRRQLWRQGSQVSVQVSETSRVGQLGLFDHLAEAPSRSNRALETTVCALLDWGCANLTLGTLLSNGFPIARSHYPRVSANTLRFCSNCCDWRQAVCRALETQALRQGLAEGSDHVTSVRGNELRQWANQQLIE